ncbi:MAG: tetratricopeptide repeat protein, partial [Dehalococcoidia bacterium]
MALRRAALFGIVAVVALVAAACGRSASSLNQEANGLYQQGDYAAALELYQRAQAERPELLELRYNAGNAFHRLGRYDRAAQEARRALFADDPQLLAKGYYSLGNHLFRQGEMDGALDAYKNALIHDPTDADA